MLNGWSFKYVVLSTNFQNYFRPCSLRQPVLRPLCGSVSVLQNFRIVKHKAVKLFSNYLILSQKLFSDPLLQSIIVKRFGLLKDWPINIVCVIVQLFFENLLSPIGGFNLENSCNKQVEDWQKLKLESNICEKIKAPYLK